MKNLNSFYVFLLLTISFVAHADNEKENVEVQQEKVELLKKYQIELYELKTKVTQLETEVFLGGYHDLIERYQSIIQKLESDIEQTNSDSITYLNLNQKLVSQQAEINDLSSSLSWNNFYLLVSMLFSIVAITRAANQ